MATYSFTLYTGAAIDQSWRSFELDDSFAAADGLLQIEITDDDDRFDGDRSNNEVGEDSTQSAIVTLPSGEQVAAGQVYVEDFFALEGPGGEVIYLDRVEIDGTFIGYAATAPLEPGVTYTRVDYGNVDDGSGSGDRDGGWNADTRLTYDQYETVPCFATGAMILTAEGPRAVERLRPGDLVRTRDRGMQPILWTASHHVTAARMQRDPNLSAVRLAAGTIRPGAPRRDLILSGQHRVLLEGAGVETLFACAEVLAAAKHLLVLPGIRPATVAGGITYHHLMFRQHEVIRANGLWVESLYAGPGLRACLPAAMVRAVAAVAPTHARTARPCLTGREVAAWAGGARPAMGTRIRA